MTQNTTRVPEPAFEGSPFQIAPFQIAQGPLVGMAPVPGRRVRKPDGSVLADAGEMIEVDADWTFWCRRISEQDVVIVLDLQTKGSAE